jgi:hypothetical protein
MNEQIARRLKEMDFRLAVNSCADCGCEVWSRTVEYGDVRSIVHIRVTEVGFDHHFVLCPSEKQERAGRQWFDDPEPRDAEDCFRDTRIVLREARQCLEGGIVRRCVRRLLEKVS